MFVHATLLSFFYICFLSVLTPSRLQRVHQNYITFTLIYTFHYNLEVVFLFFGRKLGSSLNGVIFPATARFLESAIFIARLDRRPVKV